MAKVRRLADLFDIEAKEKRKIKHGPSRRKPLSDIPVGPPVHDAPIRFLPGRKRRTPSRGRGAMIGLLQSAGLVLVQARGLILRPAFLKDFKGINAQVVYVRCRRQKWVRVSQIFEYDEDLIDKVVSENAKRIFK
jgi:hypothetical protein